VKYAALAGLIVVLFAFILTPTNVTIAQSPTPTPASAATAAPAVAADEVLAQARSASEAADRAMNTIGFILNFVQVAGLLLTGLIALLTASGFRTLGQYRAELAQARGELETMRTNLEHETEQARIRMEQEMEQVRIRVETETSEVRTRADKAIRGLEYMQLGERLLAARNFKAALDIYREAHKLDPDNRATNYFLGELYIQRKDIDKGIDHLQRALADGTDFAPAEAALGYALRIQGERAKSEEERNRLYAEAEARFLRALEIDPAARDINNESVYGVLGGLYKRRNLIDDAIRSYEKAQQVTPESSYPIVNLATLYMIAGKPDVARGYYERVARISTRLLESNPGDYWARFDLITSQTALGNLPTALAQTDTVLTQVESAGPLETFLDTLTRLKDSPYPPAGVEQVIARVTQRIAAMRSGQDK